MRPQQLALWADAAEPTGDAARAFAAFLDGHAVKTTTRNHYRETFRVYARTFGATLADQPAEIEHFLASLSCASSTRDGYYRDLKCFYRWANARLGIADATAGVRRPRLQQPLPSTLNAADVARLLRLTHRRDRALIAFALDTGARLSELAGVRRSDIQRHTTNHAEHFSVRLRGSLDASGSWRLKTGERIVPLTRPAAMLLTGIGHADYLWTSETAHAGTPAGAPLTASGIQLAIRRATLRALGRAYGPHTLRHTFATMMLRAGSDLETVRRIMGHARIETTLIYTHLVTDDLAAKHDLFSPIAQARA